MKKLLLLTLVLAYTWSLFANKINHILNHSETISMDMLDPESLKENQVLILNNFNDSKILNPEQSNFLQDKVIYSVDLVYSKSKNVNYKQQKSLNKKRLVELQNALPHLIENDLVKWTFFEQSIAGEPVKGLHGFIVTYRPDFGKTISEGRAVVDYIATPPPCWGKPSGFVFGKKKDEKLDKVISVSKYSRTPIPPSFTWKKNKTFSDFIKSEMIYTDEMREKQLTTKCFVTFDINQAGKLSAFEFENPAFSLYNNIVEAALSKMPDWTPGAHRGDFIGGTFILEVLFSAQAQEVYVTKHKFMLPFLEKGKAAIESKYHIPDFVLCDTSLFEIFNRNAHWTDMNIVADLTGSMSPYIAQLLTWLKLNTMDDKFKAFTFFNDGDRMLDADKIVGQVGGIYQAKASVYEDVVNLAAKTMLGGGGSDCPENNIEAALAAIDKFPETGDLIMIADNYATPRDMELIGEVDRPIRLILCGAYSGINLAYLNLIRENGGSVHTIESDLTNLVSMKEGESFDFHGATYKIQKGKFIRIFKS